MNALKAQTALDLRIELESATLLGDLTIPAGASGVVLFAHGSGSGRKSSRNRFVAGVLQSHGIGTLLFDLLTEQEEKIDLRTAHLRFDIELLARRLIAVTDWFRQRESAALVGFFGASTGAAAALMAAAHFGAAIDAVVSRGGRPDLAREHLAKVTAPSLLIVGERDEPVIELNEEAFAELRCPKKLEIIPRATHLFEEPGALEMVADLAANWFKENFANGAKRQSK